MADLLTTTEAAAQLGIQRRSVAKLIRTGRLAADKRGRDYFIDEAEVERYKTERKRPGQYQRPTKDTTA